ncbi:MAG: excinuclease ABC subunit UvrA [Candidatus Latescibacterota bacterium]|nr:excinuclease ABC subunit UvrA [Candidatus Latescibacterota bacterium]
MQQTIVVREACEHNLRAVDVDLPHGALVAISGVSGSGKTSLVLDTVYAEARRRFLAALDQGGGGLSRVPKVGRIDGLAPALALAQGQSRQNPRATVATLAGLYELLRLLYARVGRPHCLLCGAGVQSHRFEEASETAAGMPEGTRLVILAPRRLGEDESPDDFLAWVDRSGYRRLRIDGEDHLLEEVTPEQIAAGQRLAVVVDRLVVKGDAQRRLQGSLQAALEVGNGQVALSRQGEGEDLIFAVHPACSACGASFRAIEPTLFSFNSSAGACAVCRGLGVQSGLSTERVFAGGRATLEGALGALWQDFGHGDLADRLDTFCQKQHVDPEQPGGDWEGAAVEKLWRGTGRRGGFIGMARWLERIGAKAQGEELAWLEERLGDAPCQACDGARLRPEALAVELGGAHIAAVADRAISAVAEWLAALEFTGAKAPIGEAIRAPLDRGLALLQELGLGYLQLARRADSLSSGEFQRLRLGAALSSGMTQMLYVLDEPSAGLHARDAAQLQGALRSLIDAGNSVLLVEHDAALLRGADWLVDMGPGAGVEGGAIVAQGTPEEVGSGSSLTGRYLRGALRLEPSRGRQPQGWLVLSGARGHNLQNLQVEWPLGTLVCVAGVSGSGKSSLVRDTLHPLLAAKLQGGERRPLPYGDCTGIEQIERVVAVDQQPIGRTSRSNAATYTGLLTPLRRLFAELPEARLRAYKPAHFSFNSPEGACDTCKGSGVHSVRRGVFDDLEVLCRSCGGRRYRAEVLDVRFRERHIAAVLEMSVAEAHEFFAAVPEVARRLKTMAEVGLGYLRLGQSATSFSGGEAQRVKLAAELGRARLDHTLYILDEPTTGLHMEDVRLLLELLQRLVDEGNTVVVVEHHIELIAAADWVIDLGPEGGQAGGEIVACGRPDEVAGVKGSHTGIYLQQYLASLK